MIRVEHVDKNVGNFSMHDINLYLPKGYIMGLIGPNGSGKTSLLHLILGLYKPDGGTIKINGKDIQENESEIKNEIGYVLSEDLFLEGLTLKENANMFGKYYSNYDEMLFVSYCKQFDLNRSKKLGKHSRGEKMKFQFAFALSHNPKLLILDESTGSFDIEFRGVFLKLITEFVSDKEHSVIMATHLTEELDRIADYITFVNHGKLVFSMDRSLMENSYRLVSGEDYKINLINKEKIIYKEKGKFVSKALVRHSRLSIYEKEISVDVPTIEELMYYIVKGEEFNDKAYHR